MKERSISHRETNERFSMLLIRIINKNYESRSSSLVSNSVNSMRKDVLFRHVLFQLFQFQRIPSNPLLDECAFTCCSPELPSTAQCEFFFLQFHFFHVHPLA